MKSKVFITLLTVCTVLFAFGMVNVSAETGVYGNLTYEITSNNTITITDCSISVGTMEIEIPAEINGYPVTKIGASAFRDCGITSIKIPNGITSIGNYAFYNCTSLKKIYWNAKNVNDFSSNNYVFAYAGNATPGVDVIFGDHVDSIPAHCFSPHLSSDSYAPNITNVTFGNNVTSIGDSAFRQCQNITSITIPNSVTSIGHEAFWLCKKLSDIVIPDSVTSIGSDAFVYTAKYDTSFNAVYIGNHLVAVKSKVMENFIIKTETITIADSVFYECDFLRDIIIPDSVTNIGKTAFYSCDRLKNITIGNNVSYIGDSAFSNCKALTQINWNAKNVKNFSSFNNGVFSYAGQSGNGINVLFGDNVEYIPAYIFNSHSYSLSYEPKIVGVTIGKNVKSIGSFAFYDCSDITDVYYNGNQADWDNISIASGNEKLTKVNRKYFYYLTIYDGENTVIHKMQDADTLLDLSVVKVPEGYDAVLYTNKELTAVYNINMPIVEDLTLYVKFVPGPTGTKTTVSNDGKTFMVNLINAEKGKIVHLALYDGKIFLEMQRAVYTGDAIPFTTTVNYTNAKVMIWDGLKNLKPICDAEIIK